MYIQKLAYNIAAGCESAIFFCERGMSNTYNLFGPGPGTFENTRSGSHRTVTLLHAVGLKALRTPSVPGNVSNAIFKGRASADSCFQSQRQGSHIDI